MIRQVDPNRPITFMSPDEYAGVIKPLCEDFGGVFHNTGYMAGVWANFHSMEMGSSGLPTDVEPGSGAVDVPDFKRFLGRWSTEGIQGVDYFQHIGDIQWCQGIRECFLKTLNLWRLIGKYHTPPAQAAMLHSDRVQRLLDFPWQAEAGLNLATGHWPVRINEWLLADFPLDEVLEVDFPRGNASAYRVILDTNTCVMDPPLIDQIEKWVRAGGIFVTYEETGRHSSTHANAWPISRLSGYRVLDVAPRGRDQEFRLAPGQPVFRDREFWAVHAAWRESARLEEGAARVPRLAALARRHGRRGHAAAGPGVRHPARHDGRAPAALGRDSRLGQGPPVPATAEGLLMRHFVSNNGLYDVWALWNDKDSPRTTDLVIHGLPLEGALDVETGRPLATRADPSGVRLAGLQFEAWQTRVFLTPRCDIAAAPAAWFQLHAAGGRALPIPGKPLPDVPAKLAVDLTADWAFRPLPRSKPMFRRWSIRNSTIPPGGGCRWTLRLFPTTLTCGTRCCASGSRCPPPGMRAASRSGSRAGPAIPSWTPGGCTSTAGRWKSFAQRHRRQRRCGRASAGDDPRAGRRDHRSREDAAGLRGPAWIAYHPEPAARNRSGGPVGDSADGLRYGPPTALPGPLVGKAARRTVKIDASHASRNVVVHAVADNYPLSGVLINGRFVLRFRHNLGSEINLNITPWVKFGEDNELILVGNGGSGILPRGLAGVPCPRELPVGRFPPVSLSTSAATGLLGDRRTARSGAA